LREQLQLVKTTDRMELLGGAPFGIEEIEGMIYPAPPEGDGKLAAIIEDRAPELAAFDRYERRALSKRKSAIRSFDARRYREEPKRKA
jgi:hypothetical protein